MRSIILYILLFFVLILLQVLVLNNIHLGGYANIFLYIWLILKMPNGVPRGVLISMGFLIGLIIDLFANTPGMHALATAYLAYMRTPLLYLFISRDDMKTGTPSIQGMGVGVFARYLGLAVLLFCTSLYLIEAFSFFKLSILLLKIVSSSIMTFLLLFGIEGLIQRFK